MRYNFIKNWSDFILNETLKTNDIDLVIGDIESELRLTGIDCDLIKNINKIELIIYDFYKLDIIEDTFLYLDSLFIDRNGWFPSRMKLVNIHGKENEFKYDEDYLISNHNILTKVIIIYEPKFDKITNIPSKLYHLSIQHYANSILKLGLIPKSKNKKTIQLDRIYFCSDPNDCYKLIPQIQLDYKIRKNRNKLDNVDLKWIIYEISTKNIEILYKDPNYIDKGFYIVDNIPPQDIIIYDKE